MSKTTPDDVCALCYHHKSEAATCNREDCELSYASPCSPKRVPRSSRKLGAKKVCPLRFTLEEDGTITESPNPDFRENDLHQRPADEQTYSVE